VRRRPTRLATFAVLVFALTLAWGVPALASAAPVTVAALASRVASASAAVSSLRSRVASATVAGELADRVDASLPEGLEVAEGTTTMPVGDVPAVHTLTSRLREATAASVRREVATQLAAHLASMRRAIGGTGTVPSDPAALRELLAARPVTTDTGGNWLDQQIQKVLQWVADWLATLRIPGTTSSPFSPSRLIPVVVIAVPVLLVAWVLLRARRRRRGKGESAVAAAADLPDDPLAYAELLASEGRHRDALRVLYGGAARHLVETGVVTRMRTRTDLEMLRDVRAAAPALAPAFGRLTVDFESAWYGHADPGGHGFYRARESYESVVAAAGTAPAVEIPFEDGGTP
jgi:hypothetical protein